MKSVKNQRGFTLTEVLISLLIISILIVGFAALLSNSYSDIFLAGRKSKAIFSAQQQIESTLADIVYMETLVADPNYSGGVDISPTTITVGTHIVSGKRVYVEMPYTDRSGNEVTLAVYTFVLY